MSEVDEFEKLVEKSISGGRFTDFDAMRYQQLKALLVNALTLQAKLEKAKEALENYASASGIEVHWNDYGITSKWADEALKELES